MSVSVCSVPTGEGAVLCPNKRTKPSNPGRETCRTPYIHIKLMPFRIRSILVLRKPHNYRAFDVQEYLQSI